ncbi:flagellar hook-length control protein FliK [Aeromonas simiae]|uniref:flagellar hook-length control protein FliK n=1 Tax=Aeromonas simiae TaxID=218936 RepID=UPI00266B657E|nr:flagellar hook-length control protein FliK [Aeromonas simiae]
MNVIQSLSGVLFDLQEAPIQGQGDQDASFALLIQDDELDVLPDGEQPQSEQEPQPELPVSGVPQMPEPVQEEQAPVRHHHMVEELPLKMATTLPQQEEVRRTPQSAPVVAQAEPSSSGSVNEKPMQVKLVTTSPLPDAVRVALGQLGQRGGEAGVVLTQASELQDVSAMSGTAPAQVLSRQNEFQWAPVRLGDSAAQWGQQLVEALRDKVDLQVNQQVKQAHIRLDPPDLGRLELSVRMDGDKLTVQLNAANPAIREALIQSMERLRMALALHHSGGVEVNVGQEGREGRQQEQATRDTILAGRRGLWDEPQHDAEGTSWLDALV